VPAEEPTDGVIIPPTADTVEVPAEEPTDGVIIPPTAEAVDVHELVPDV
jgi:hypothetical protein